MGTKYSQSNNEEMKEQKKLPKTFNNNKNYNCETEDLSLIITTKENTDNSSLTTTTENMDNNKNMVPFNFEWKGRGNQVILKGTFANNWKDEIILNKNIKTGIFEKTIYLPKTKHSFKFIVDNVWVCSNQYPTIKDNANTNNFIDLTNANPNPNLVEKQLKVEENKIEANINIINNNNNIKNIGGEKKTKKAKKIFDCKIPSYNELNITAPTIIHHYKPTFNINYQSRQDLIVFKGKKPTLKYKEKNFNNENNTYGKIMVWPHEKLLHLCPHLDELNEDNDNYFKICTTVRIKHKYLTLVYYRPK